MQVGKLARNIAQKLTADADSDRVLDERGRWRTRRFGKLIHVFIFKVHRVIVLVPGLLQQTDGDGTLGDVVTVMRQI